MYRPLGQASTPPIPESDSGIPVSWEMFTKLYIEAIMTRPQDRQPKMQIPACFFSCVLLAYPTLKGQTALLRAPGLLAPAHCSCGFLCGMCVQGTPGSPEAERVEFC